MPQFYLKSTSEDVYTWNSVPEWNHPSLWWNIPHFLHTFVEIKFHSGMNSSLSKRQGWKKEKITRKHFNLDRILKWAWFYLIFDAYWRICFPPLTYLNKMNVKRKILWDLFIISKAWKIIIISFLCKVSKNWNFSLFLSLLQSFMYRIGCQKWDIYFLFDCSV